MTAALCLTLGSATQNLAPALETDRIGLCDIPCKG